MRLSSRKELLPHTKEGNNEYKVSAANPMHLTDRPRVSTNETI